MSCGCNLRKRIIKEKISISKRDVYLDYNATTKPNLDALAAIDRVNRNFWGNPSAQNSRGVNLFNLLIEEITKIKKIFKINNDFIYFDVSSSSLIKRIAANVPDKTIITTQIEHNSLINNSNIKIKVDTSGKMDLSKLKTTISNNRDSILIYSPVNHETGNIQNIKEIYSICRENEVNVILDAVQTIPRVTLKNWLPFCDGFYYSGHKIHGIQGAAVLILKEKIIDFRLEDTPLPFSLYDGTFNTPGVIGLLEATKVLFHKYDDYLNDLKVLHKEALNILKRLDENYIIESDINSAPGIINISLPIIDKVEDLLIHLNREAIQIGRLSACSGDINMESHVLKAMGRNSDRSSTSLRISFGRESKRDDFFRLTSAIMGFLSFNYR